MMQPSHLTILEAGRLVGRSKSSMFRLVKSGQMSAERDAQGVYRVELSELARVFPLVQLGVPNGALRHSDDPAVAHLEARLADALDQVHDLRQRLDRSEQRAERLTAMLTDSRSPAPPAADAVPTPDSRVPASGEPSTDSQVSDSPRPRRRWLPWRR